MKYTQGPWEVIDRTEHGSIRSAISDKVSAEDFPFEVNMPSPPFALGATGALIARKGGIGTREGSAEANARLMAAAPELLAALRHAIQRNHEFSGGCAGCVAATLAIKKAEGEL